MPGSDLIPKQASNVNAPADKGTSDVLVIDDMIKQIGLLNIKRLAITKPVYQSLLGFLCLLAETDELNAMDLIRSAAQSGNKISKLLLNYLEALSTQDAALTPTQRVVKCLEQEASIEGPFTTEATYRLSLACLFGRGTKQDSKKAIDHLNEAAVGTHPFAQFLLGKIFDEGKIVPKNDVLAYVYYSVAAQQDIDEAQIAIANRLDNGIGVTQNPRQACYWRTVVHAKNGDIESLFYLGESYEFARDVPEDFDLAYEFYCLAAKMGHVLAKTRAAFILIRSRKSTVDDYLKGITWIEEALAHDEREALFIMSTFHRSGLMQPKVEKNEALALEYIGKSARLGYEAAQKLIFLKNLDVGVEPSQPRKWVHELALKGDKDAKDMYVEALRKDGKNTEIKIFLKRIEKQQRKNNPPKALEVTAQSKLKNEIAPPSKSFLPQFTGSQKPLSQVSDFETKIDILSSKVSQMKMGWES